MSKTKDGKGTGRTHWLDEKTDTPLIDQYVQKLGTFLEAMADGRIDASELKAQEERVVALMKTIEPELDDELHEQVTHLLCELSAYNIMHTIHQLVEPVPRPSFGVSPILNWGFSPGGAVAKVVVCPSCQYQGSIPDDVKAPRIRCPKCKQGFDVAAATQKSGGPAKAPALPKRPPAAVNTAFDDLESVEPLPTLSTTGIRRTPSVAPQPRAGTGQSPIVYVSLGLGGLAVVLLGAVLFVVTTRGGGEPPAAKASRADLVQNESPPPVIETIASKTPDSIPPRLQRHCRSTGRGRHRHRHLRRLMA